MGDRLQRILARQQEHERRMRERDMVKAAFEAPPKEVDFFLKTKKIHKKE